MTEYELPESPIILKMANLRQAVEWIAFALKPIPKEYEIAIRGNIKSIQDSDITEIDYAKRLLYLALFETQIIAEAWREGDPPDTAYVAAPRYKITGSLWQLDKIQWDDSQMLPAFDWDDNAMSFSLEKRKFINIHLSTDKLYEVFPYPSLKRKSAVSVHHRPNYYTPYMQLMDLAITEFNISNSNQPSTKILVDWFFNKLKEMPGEMYLSMAKAKMLATFVREPEAQKGGLKKLNATNSYK